MSRTRSQIKNRKHICEGKNTWKIKIYEIDPYFFQHYRKKKVQVNKNWCKYILFRIDVYFTEYLLAVDIDEKGHTDKDLTFEEKRQKAIEKKLGFKFLRISTSEEGHDADYEDSRIQTFISKFKDRKLAQLKKN